MADPYHLQGIYQNGDAATAAAKGGPLEAFIGSRVAALDLKEGDTVRVMADVNSEQTLVHVHAIRAPRKEDVNG